MNTNQRLIENAMDSKCQNSYDCHDGGILSDNCNLATSKHNTCASIAKQLLAYTNRDHNTREVDYTARAPISMDTYDKKSLLTLIQLWDVQYIIMLLLISIAVARVAGYKFTQANGKVQQLKMCLIEFILIAVPTIVSFNILNPYIKYIIALAALTLGILVWRSKCLKKAAQREYEFGSRPAVLTLLRSTMNLLTSVSILAIDFESFPKKFRKSRRYGASVMDIGIGMFVILMASVSLKPKSRKDIRKSVFTVVCLLVLGLGRTLVITAIDYAQDEHEYGVHLNAFFILGFTKLFATLLLFLVKSNRYVLALGVAILIFHEIALQLGASSYVMDANLKRTNFLRSNREGLWSLPGYVGLFLVSQYLMQWLKANDILNFEEIKGKLINMFCVCVVLWLLVISSTMSIGIARVTCNLGYVAWVLASFVTNCILYLFVFDIVLDTVYPVDSKEVIGAIEEVRLVNKPVFHSTYGRVPFIMESLNYNGLLYFLISNILTGMTNIFLGTDDRTNMESVLILIGYAFIPVFVVSVLYRFKIRIA